MKEGLLECIFSFIHRSVTNLLSQPVFAVTTELISKQQKKKITWATSFNTS